MKIDVSEFYVPEEIDPNWKIGIIHTVYYENEMASLVKGASQVFEDAGIALQNITTHAAFGSFEIPLLGKVLLERGDIDALIGFGIIVQGDTQHANHLAREVARSMMGIQLQYQAPFAYEVLHVNTLEEAQERAGSSNNKGIEAAKSVLHSLAELRRIKS